MKKFLLCTALCLPLALSVSACKKGVDYFEYVSEYRKSVYYYEDDNITLKIYSVDRETPAALDGIKGQISNITEVYYSCEKTASEVEISLLGYDGEMSYLAVTQNYYLSFSGGDLSGGSIPVTVTADGKETKVDVLNVADDGTLDGKTALKCVREYDAKTFENLTSGNNFTGEIVIRLLYDEGYYYYVGVCDREGRMHAYLVDGTDGRIIAERESDAE